jgi:hypothetical protein
MLRFITLFLSIFLLTACPAKKESPTTVVVTPTSPAAPSAATTPPSVPSVPSAPTLPGYSTPDQAVKGFFNSVNDKRYDEAWSGLSAKSQQKIIAMVAQDEKMETKDVKAMFDENKTPIQRGFWDAFRNSSKASEFVPGSSYKTLSESGDVATVELSSGNVKLEIKAYKEGTGWKTGYVETFME